MVISIKRVNIELNVSKGMFLTNTFLVYIVFFCQNKTSGILEEYTNLNFWIKTGGWEMVGLKKNIFCLPREGLKKLDYLCFF